MKAPAATLVALTVDNGEGGGTGAGDDHRAVVAAKGAGMSGVDVVIGLHGSEWPWALLEDLAIGDRAAAGHAKTGIGAGIGAVGEPGSGKRGLGAVQYRAVGRLAVLDLEVGRATAAFAQSHQILVGEADAAVRASSVDAKIVSGHLPAPENIDAPARRARTIMRLMPVRKWFVQSIAGLSRHLSGPCPATNAGALR